MIALQRLVPLFVIAVFAFAVVAQAQEPAETGAAQEAAAAAQVGPQALINLTGSFGAGLVIIGAAYGIGRLASASFEGMARQPEVANTIRGAMIIAAALIEGATFFALVVCILVG